MNQNAVRNGWMLGVSLIIISLVFYLISPRAFLTFAGWARVIACFYFLYRASADERNDQGGFISFGEVFKVSFVTAVVGYAIFWVFNYILFNFIDPSLADTQKQIAMEAMEKWAGFMGDDVISEVEKQDFGATIGRTFASFAGSLIMPGVFVSLIMGLVVRRKNSGGLTA